jgi:hypothetical protein
MPMRLYNASEQYLRLKLSKSDATQLLRYQQLVVRVNVSPECRLRFF